jgi:hypothetical protein
MKEKETKKDAHNEEQPPCNSSRAARGIQLSSSKYCHLRPVGILIGSDPELLCTHNNNSQCPPH